LDREVIESRGHGKRFGKMVELGLKIDYCNSF